jgi:F0F1-type ATP synthase membrane subunit c/vacuolar-type H+-ATPase subunit K
MADHIHEPVEVDPRKALAERYLQKARAELAAKEAERPQPHRADGKSNESVALGDLWPRISGSTYIHFILLVPVMTLAALAAVWCLILIEFSLIVGRIIVLPAGILLMLAISYAMAYYLGVIESTSHGETTPDESLRGTWQDWFWLLPATIGVCAMAAGIGYLVSLPFPGNRGLVIGITTLVLYPLMQLSSLETGSPFAPFSWAMTKTLITHPLMWLSVYAITFLVALAVTGIAKAAWRDPPYFTAAIIGLILPVVLLVYGLVFGTACRWLSLKGR